MPLDEGDRWRVALAPCYDRGMNEGTTSEVTVRWFVEPFAEQKRLDETVRWLLAATPAASIVDDADQCVMFAERAELALDHPWVAVVFDSGLILRVAEPIDVPRGVFSARLERAAALIRAIYGARDVRIDNIPGGGRGGAPAEARVFAPSAARAKN